MTQEELLLTHSVIAFRAEHFETIKIWERQLAKDECAADLHFCYHALEEYPNLIAHLDAAEYRLDFAINAHILHARLQEQFLDDGHTGPIALEHANNELLKIYSALNEKRPVGLAAIVKTLQ
ncbi:hypothetical protein [Maribacter sp. Hel_I_7]|uniref:hypothetical protein n=1 Tax=Maribacter sp. Hel_I_7 TaxID=1249997 RepID=UPI00047A685E|nr:hypothetical protein [Maribacter sp. Hel_I_7]|tara:strand:+ start:182 stop:547 length:366 start_codon:yes stop_codon:yes gene_type:complete